ncbi:MAG TPA: class I SAM-dependent methyltransferase [Arthrobacter sp.]|nr:class I SAM-dependent methyltransferase [Arthrobacter sp.]
MSEHKGHSHGHTEVPDDFWESFYAERDQIWSGKPNAMLVREASDLQPGTALELGCGEGADAIWLATQGWQVTGVDVSGLALERAAKHAEDAGVAEKIQWLKQDLSGWEPDTQYDLVSAQFLHSPVELPRNSILAAAARAVAPGGALLVGGHESFPSWSKHPEPHEPLPTAAELAVELGLNAPDWSLETVDSVVRDITGPEGQAGTLTDSVLLARRAG